jgi:D-lactate dehydrogenase (cytochrome)
VQIDACNRFSKLGLPVEPHLFLEFHGTEAGVAEQSEMVGVLAAENGGTGFQWAARAEERNRLWEARHNVYYAGLALRPGARIWATDVCVPISRLADCIVETKADVMEAGVLAPIVGHVGDGNFHLTIVLDPDDPAEMARAEAINARLVERALAMGGTCTGEHGVGTGKIWAVEREHGEAVDVMRTLKAALDPDGLMNPGKVLRMG